MLGFCGFFVASVVLAAGEDAKTVAAKALRRRTAVPQSFQRDNHN